VLTEYHHADAANTGKDVPFPMPEGLKTTFAQIEQVAPVWASHNDKLLIPDYNGTTIKTFKEDKGVFLQSLHSLKCLITRCLQVHMNH